MTIHLVQVTGAVLLLVFGVLALQVQRRIGPARRDRATLAWSVTAAYFLVSGGYTAANAVLAAVGAVIGHDSALYLWVSGWSLEATLARGFVSVVFAGLVLALMTLRRRWVFRLARSAPLVLTAITAAATATVLQVPLQKSFYYSVGTALAVMSALAAVLLMGALLAAVLNDGMDQLLWFSLALYALKETMTVSQMAVLAWWGLAPDRNVYYLFFFSGVALGAGMCAVAVRRLRLAGSGRRVPALFERLYPARGVPAS